MTARAKSVRTLTGRPERCSSLVGTRPCRNFPIDRATVRSHPMLTDCCEFWENTTLDSFNDLNGDLIRDEGGPGSVSSGPMP
ncbi:hypothetical protein TNCV_4897281 [Trichonephila clavipes]|nr:hypothetical protein TNCV_4897281 [Trichonephila clavipes]